MSNKLLWYGLFSLEGDGPICITKDNPNWIKNNLQKIIQYSKINLLENPTHLQYLVKDSDGTIKASFEFEPHAMKYQVENFGLLKSFVEPNLVHSETPSQ